MLTFPFISARDAWLQGGCEVCGQRGAGLRHAEIQRGPWLVAHSPRHAHQHAGWVRFSVVWTCNPDIISARRCPAGIYSHQPKPSSLTHNTVLMLIWLRLRQELLHTWRTYPLQQPVYTTSYIWKLSLCFAVLSGQFCWYSRSELSHFYTEIVSSQQKMVLTH